MTKFCSVDALRIALSDPGRAARRIHYEFSKFFQPGNLVRLRRKYGLWLRNVALANKPISARVAGWTLRLVPQGLIAETLWSGREHEAAELALICRFLNDDSVFLDVGANVGLFSLAASKACPTARIFAFEPTSKTFNRLIQNIRLNDARNVMPFRLALSDVSGTAMLNVNVDSRDALNTLGNPCHPDFHAAGTEVVSVATLDEFLLSHAIPRVDVVKVDAEGAELLIFRGAQALLQRPDAPLILYEAITVNTRAFDYHAVEIFWLLDRWGFCFFTLDPRTGRLVVPRASRAYESTVIAVKKSHAMYSVVEELAR